MSFRYKARDAFGKVQDGVLDVDSRGAATDTLERDGLTIVALEDSDDDEPLLARGISAKDVIYTTSQLAIMVDTGITLSSALESLLKQESNVRLKRVLTDLKSRVEAGEDFSSALARHPAHFDATFIALVRASEQTGTLGEMLERISGYLRGDLETRSKVKAALAYPGIMLAVAVGVTTFLITYVMPKFTPIFEQRKVKLPLPTIVLMSLSKAILGYWYLWLIGIAALIGGFWYFRRTAVGRRTLDYVKLHVPIIGPMIRKMVLSRSIRTLGTMVRSGVSMLEALKLTADVCGNTYYRNSWLQVIEQVTEGRRIAESLEGNSLFPSTLVQMIASGEETGRLDDVLEKVSTYYDRDLELSIKTTVSLMEPIMIVCMGFVVGGIAMALLLPIFQLSRPNRH